MATVGNGCAAHLWGSGLSSVAQRPGSGIGCNPQTINLRTDWFLTIVVSPEGLTSKWSSDSTKDSIILWSTRSEILTEINTINICSSKLMAGTLCIKVFRRNVSPNTPERQQRVNSGADNRYWYTSGGPMTSNKTSEWLKKSPKEPNVAEKQRSRQ